MDVYNSSTRLRKEELMKTANSVLAKHQNKTISAINARHQATGKPVALTDLEFFSSLTRSEKISLGRGFKKAVDCGDINGVRHHGRRKDNHATYVPTGVISDGSGLGFIATIKRAFGG